jgi:CheY-like chemotaxis protein
VEEPGLRAQDRVVPAGRYVTLSIRDTGSGMDAATAARVFEPFFTTKEPGKGTGLGLSTVHGIVHQSGGYLALESALGRGTTFTIYLPRIPDAAEVAAARAEPDPNLVRGTGTILLVEDDDELRRLAAEVLAAAGYTILAAGDPLEALTLCDRRDGPIDLLLTDMVMPAMRGPELAAQLWESRPGVKVLIMSGYTESRDADQPRWSFMQKPFTPQGLTHAVRAALAAPAYPPRA